MDDYLASFISVDYKKKCFMFGVLFSLYVSMETLPINIQNSKEY